MERYTPLVYAIKGMNKDAVHMLLENGAIPKSDDINMAMDIHQYNIVNLLLDFGANMPQDRLYWDCEQGNLQHVIYIIEQRLIDPNIVSKLYTTPIAISCIKGHMDIVDYLLQHTNIDINDGVIGSQTLLHIATSTNNIDAISFLLDKGANINIQDNRGRTPLISAIDNKHTTAYKLLLERGANRFTCHTSLYDPVVRLCPEGGFQCMPDDDTVERDDPYKIERL